MAPVAARAPAGRVRRRVAAGALLVSAPVNAVGVTALIAMFVAFATGQQSAGMSLGRTNDILGLIGTVLMMPAVFEIHALTGPDRRALRGSLAVVGLGAMVAIVWLQFLLITDRMPFATQVQLVSVAYLAIAIWFIGGGWIASRAGVMPHGARLGAFASLYVGQPWWAYRWGRLLLASAAEGLRSGDALRNGEADPAGVVVDRPSGEADRAGVVTDRAGVA